MPKHIWSVVCNRVIIDSLTNQISLLTVVEQLTAKSSHSTSLEHSVILPYNLEVATLWELGAEDTESQSKMELIAPDNISIVASGTASMVPGERFRSIYNVPGIPFQGFGRYIFRVSGRSSEKADWQIGAEVSVVLVDGMTAGPKTTPVAPKASLSKKKPSRKRS